MHIYLYLLNMGAPGSDATILDSLLEQESVEVQQAIDIASHILNWGGTVRYHYMGKLISSLGISSTSFDVLSGFVNEIVSQSKKNDKSTMREMKQLLVSASNESSASEVLNDMFVLVKEVDISDELAYAIIFDFAVCFNQIIRISNDITDFYTRAKRVLSRVDRVIRCKE